MVALVSTQDMSREQWLEYRRKGIGGSDASIVCGVNKYTSPVELWMQKTGQLPPSESGEAAYWGTKLESLIRDEFTLRTGIEVKQVPYILQSRLHPFMICNLDGVCNHPDYGKCVVEIKTCNAFKAGEWDNGAVPLEYLMQIQHYLSITNYNAACVAVLVGGNDFRWTIVERDESVIGMLIQKERDFWNQVELGIAPDVDGSDSCSVYLSKRYSTCTPSKIQLPDSAAALIKQYQATREQLELLTAQKQEAENLLKEMLGNNASGVVGGNIVSWSAVNKESFDSKTFKSEQPALHAQYTKQTTYRRFVIKAAS